MSIALNLDHAANAARATTPARRSLVGLGRPELRRTLMDIGLDEREAKMRSSQLWNWMYVNGVTDFDRMTNIQKGFRQKLADNFLLDGRRSSPNRFPSTAPASGCSASAIRRTPSCRQSRSRPSTFRKKTAARSACLAGRLHAHCSFCHTGHRSSSAT